MLEEQLKEHGEVILWWLNHKDDKIWQREYADYKWELVKNPEFKLSAHYVQNDEYAGLRKAMIDGKIIQYYVNGFIGWQNTNNFNNPMRGLENYRIKPTDT